MKPRTQRQIAAAAAVVLAAVSHKWWALAGAAAIVVGVWLWRLWRQPMGPCWACRGRSGRNVGSDESQWGYCARCSEKTPGGRGEEPRIGAVLMHPELRRK